MTEPDRQSAAAGPSAATDRLPPWLAALSGGGRPLWVFAYGSLMWSPEIPHEEARPALVRGWHRGLCVYSYDYRGSRARPGLVLGLDRGGACRGVALRLPAEHAATALAVLWEREMTDEVYDLRLVPAHIAGCHIPSLAFVVRRGHPHYAGRLPLEEAARLIADAAGIRGTCRDYLALTIGHLAALGLEDRGLRRLDRLVGRLTAR